MQGYVKRKVLGVLRDDRIATLKKFLSKILGDKVREVHIDNHTTNDFIEGYNTKIKMLKRMS